MAYKSRVTNKYMGSSFAGQVASSNKSSTTDLINTLQKEVNPALAKIADQYVETKKDTAKEKINQLFLTKDSKTVQQEILAGKHPELSNAYVSKVVDLHSGKKAAVETMAKIAKNIDSYDIENDNLPAFYKQFYPEFNQQSSTYALGFAAVFEPHKAKAAIQDATKRAELAKQKRFDSISSVLDSVSNAEEYHKQANSYIVQVPPEEGSNKTRYLNSPSEMNEYVLQNLTNSIATATDTQQLGRIEDIINADRGVGKGGNKLGSISSNKTNPKHAKLISDWNTKYRALSAFQVADKTRKDNEKKSSYLQSIFAADRETVEGEQEYQNLKAAALKEYPSLAVTLNSITKNTAAINEDSGGLSNLNMEVMTGKWNNKEDALRRELSKFTNSQTSVQDTMNKLMTSKKYEASGYLPPLQEPAFKKVVGDIQTLLVSKLQGVDKKYESQKATYVSNLLQQDIAAEYMVWLSENERPSKLDSVQLKNDWYGKQKKFFDDTYNEKIKKYDTSFWLTAISDLVNREGSLTVTGADLKINFEAETITSTAKQLAPSVAGLTQEAETTMQSPVDIFMNTTAFKQLINKPEWSEIKNDADKQRGFATKILDEAGVELKDYTDDKNSLLDKINSNTQSFTLPPIETYTPLGLVEKGASQENQQNYFINVLEQLAGRPINMSLYNSVLTEDAKLSLAKSFNINTLQLDELAKEYLK